MSKLSKEAKEIAKRYGIKNPELVKLSDGARYGCIVYDDPLPGTKPTEEYWKEMQKLINNRKKANKGNDQ